MASRKERFVAVYEFSVRPARVSTQAAMLTLANFETMKKYVYNHRKKHQQGPRESIEEDRLFISLDDVNIDVKKKIVALLFTVVDANAADAVYRRLSDGEQRLIRKNPDEGGASSAHLVIDLDVPENHFRYRAALEESEGVSRTRIQPFLEEMFRTACGTVEVEVDGEDLSGPAKVQFDSLHQDKLKDAEGRPLRVELVQLHKRKELDPQSGDVYYERKRTIDFGINTKSTVEAALDAVMSIRKKQQRSLADYPLMRIRWQRPDRRQQTLPVDDLREDLLAKAFTKLILLDRFQTELPAATVTIVPEFVAKATAALRR